MLAAACAMAVMLAACGPVKPVTPDPITEIELPAPGTFTVSVSGSVETEFSGGGRAATVAAMGRAIYLSGERFSANLVLPGDQAAGTFEILPLMSAFNAAQRVMAVGGVLVDAEQNPDPEAQGVLPVSLYDSVRSGRVTLLSVNPLSGAFEFTAANVDGLEVTVRAVFAALPEESDAQ